MFLTCNHFGHPVFCGTQLKGLGYLKLLVRNPSFEIQTFDKFHVEDGGDYKNCRSRNLGGFRRLHGAKNATDELKHTVHKL